MSRVGIDRIAAGGDGVGRLPDGRAVFVPRTAPGDQAEIEVVRAHTRFARGRLRSLEGPGPDRTEPRCRHYRDDDCGGCQLQHLTEPAQRAARRAIAGDALRRIARLELPDPPIERAPAEWNYRTRITVARAPGNRFGFHRQGQPDRVFELERCEIARETLNALWSRVRSARELLPPNAEHLTLREDADGGLHIVVHAGAGPAWTKARALHARVTDTEHRVTVWWRPAGGATRAMAGGADMALAVPFEQVDPIMGDRIRRYAVAALGDPHGATTWDLYAGRGQAAELLAERGARVQSVEVDPRAVGAARARLAARGLEVDSRVGLVEQTVATLAAPELVIANPPRAGLHPAVVDALRDRSPRRLAYVSCDPATLARDVGRLVAGGCYAVADLRAFDLFPQTAHVETVAVLECR